MKNQQIELKIETAPKLFPKFSCRFVKCTKAGQGFEKNRLYPIFGYGDSGVEIYTESRDSLFLKDDGRILRPQDGNDIYDDQVAEFEYFDTENLDNHIKLREVFDYIFAISVITGAWDRLSKEKHSPEYSKAVIDAVEALANKALLECSEVLPVKVVETNDALDEGRRGGAVHDVGNGEVDAGRKSGNSIVGLLSDCCEKFDEKFAIAKALKVENGLVVGDGTFDGCNIGDGKFSLFGICADYFTKFETPGWIPETERDYLSTLSFVQAFLGYKEGIEWMNGHLVFGWRAIKG